MEIFLTTTQVRSLMRHNLLLFTRFCSIAERHGEFQGNGCEASGSCSSIYVHNREQWPPDMLSKFLADCNIKTDFVTEEDEQHILAEMQPHLKRMRWEEEHWDDQIRHYREREQHIDSWSSGNQALIRRIWASALPPPLTPSPFVHVLDLHQNGFIRPHFDKSRYCGRVISGLSLLSTSVMRMRHQNAELANSLMADLLLSRRSLYRLSGMARYEFTHELLSAGEESRFGDQMVDRKRRVALICREMPLEEEKEQITR